MSTIMPLPLMGEKEPPAGLTQRMFTSEARVSALTVSGALAGTDGSRGADTTGAAGFGAGAGLFCFGEASGSACAGVEDAANSDEAAGEEAAGCCCTGAGMGAGAAARSLKKPLMASTITESPSTSFCSGVINTSISTILTYPNIATWFAQCHNTNTMHPVSTRERAIELRLAGYSYTYISLRTGLSKSTLSDWLCRIPYTPNTETTQTIGKALAASGSKIMKKKQENIQLARQEARSEVGEVLQRDLFMFGLGLYLGEGSKTNNITRIANSDPRVIKFAIAWFKALGLSTKNLRIRLHLYPDSDVEKSTEFWIDCTGLPREQFLKHQIDWRKNKKTYKLGKLPYGTAHIGVKSLGEKRHGVFLSRKILAWIEAMSEKI